MLTARALLRHRAKPAAPLRIRLNQGLRRWCQPQPGCEGRSWALIAGAASYSADCEVFVL